MSTEMSMSPDVARLFEGLKRNWGWRLALAAKNAPAEALAASPA